MKTTVTKDIVQLTVVFLNGQIGASAIELAVQKAPENGCVFAQSRFHYMGVNSVVERWKRLDLAKSCHLVQVNLLNVTRR